MSDDRQIILASGSPRRRELLSDLGTGFGVVVSDADESSWPDESPSQLAMRLAEAKALAVASSHQDDVVIAADTLVVLDGEVLGKPADSVEAIDMLRRLRAKKHVVHTGLAVFCLSKDVRLVQLASTPVVMRDYSDVEIRAYVATGNSLDKAGAYAIQSSSFQPVASICDCYANVMGLPLCHLYSKLVALLVPVPVHPLQACPYARENGGCEWAEGILSSTG